MLKIKLKTLFLVLIFSSAFFSELKAAHTDTSDLTEAYDPKPMIMHHVLNAHEWHLFDYKDNEGKSHPVSIPLPIILFTEGSIDVFLSSERQVNEVNESSMQIVERKEDFQSFLDGRSADLFNLSSHKSIQDIHAR